MGFLPDPVIIKNKNICIPRYSSILYVAYPKRGIGNNTIVYIMLHHVIVRHMTWHYMDSALSEVGHRLFPVKGEFGGLQAGYDTFGCFVCLWMYRFLFRLVVLCVRGVRMSKL